MTRTGFFHISTTPVRRLVLLQCLTCLSSLAPVAAPLAPAAWLSAQEPGSSTAELTHGRSAALWSARVAPVTAVGGGLLAAAASQALCEYDPCTGRFEAFIAGAMVGAAAGAVLGAAIGWAFWAPGPAPVVPPPGTGGTRWSVMAGLPDGVEAFGYDSCVPPQTTTSLEVRIGRPLRAGWDGFLEASSRRYEDSGCEGQPGLNPDPGTIDDAASSFSILGGVSRPLLARERLVLDLVGGVARTSWSGETVALGLPTGEVVRRSGYGLHLGAGLRAGWYMGFGGSLRMGVSLRGDWIASSPMGSLPMATLGIGLWG